MAGGDHGLLLNRRWSCWNKSNPVIVVDELDSRLASAVRASSSYIVIHNPSHSG